MKKKLAITFLIVFNSLVFSATNNVSFDFEFSETGINRALVTQFNDPNFAFKQFTGVVDIGSYVNVPYTVQLRRPTIVIGNDFIGINLYFTFEASLGGTSWSHQFEVTPSVTVDETSIYASEVVAFLDNLDDEINEHTEIELPIRILLIGLYNVYKPQIYASKLFDEVLEEINSNDFIQQRAFKVIDFGIEPSFNSGKFVLKGTLILSTYDKVFVTKITEGNPDKLFFNVNIKCKIKKVLIYTGANLDVLYSNTNLDIELIKNQSGDFYSAEIELGNIVGENTLAIWEVLYETDNTFYYNQYKNYPNIIAIPAETINN